jgi:hypothetical protein
MPRLTKCAVIPLLGNMLLFTFFTMIKPSHIYMQSLHTTGLFNAIYGMMQKLYFVLHSQTYFAFACQVLCSRVHKTAELCAFLTKKLHCNLGNQWHWIKFVLCCIYMLMVYVDTCFKCFEDRHTKMKYWSSANHIMCYRYYRTCLQNFNKMLPTSQKLQIL